MTYTKLDNWRTVERVLVPSDMEYIESGIASSDSNFVFNQVTALAVWTIDHPLNKMPSVTVVDSSGNTVYGDIKYISNSRVTVTFNSGFAGVAYLN